MRAGPDSGVDSGMDVDWSELSVSGPEVRGIEVADSAVSSMVCSRAGEGVSAGDGASGADDFSFNVLGAFWNLCNGLDRGLGRVDVGILLRLQVLPRAPLSSPQPHDSATPSAPSRGSGSSIGVGGCTSTVSSLPTLSSPWVPQGTAEVAS